MKITPYTTSKGVQIGCRYEPPPHIATQEELNIQAVLLGHNRRDWIDTLILLVSVMAAVGIVVALVMKGMS